MLEVETALKVERPPPRVGIPRGDGGGGRKPRVGSQFLHHRPRVYNGHSMLWILRRTRLSGAAALLNTLNNNNGNGECLLEYDFFLNYGKLHNIDFN